MVGQPGDRGGTDRTLKMSGNAGCRDADHVAVHIDQRPPGETRIEREIDREHRVGLALTAAPKVERADDAGAGPWTRAESQDQMADAKVAIVVDVGSGHAGDLGAEHGDVQSGVAADDLRC